MDASITLLLTQSKTSKTESTEFSKNLDDLKNELENTKNSLHENN